MRFSMPTIRKPRRSPVGAIGVDPGKLHRIGYRGQHFVVQVLLRSAAAGE
jgi:hypothetical protein